MMFKMASVIPNYVESMYPTSLYVKKCLSYGPALFFNMADSGHLEF